MIMPFIQTQRLKHYFEQNGSGDALLVMNGTGSDLRKKPNIMDSPLSSAFHVISYDHRGLGQTDKPKDGYTMADYADDAAALLDALNIERVHVLGISFGGMVAQEFALRHKSRVTRLALFCTAPGGGGGSSYPLHELNTLDEETRLFELMKLNDARLNDKIIKTNPDMVALARQRTDLSAYSHEPSWAEGRAGQLAARAEHDCWDRLSDINCPVWLAGGTFDNIAKPEIMQNMLERLSIAELTLYEGGHLFMLQDGKVFPDTIGFFRGTNT